jgi:hypothetical protein
MDLSAPDGIPPFSPLAGVAAAFMTRLAEFTFEPGLVAAVDQHAAELCDRLAGRMIPHQREVLPCDALVDCTVHQKHEVQAPEYRSLDRGDLADYILGFNDALAEVDWREPVGYDYATLRLTAICWLIREQDLLAS